LDVRRSTISDNQAGFLGGGLVNAPDGFVNIDDSYILRNLASGSVVFVIAETAGGGIHNMGEMRIFSSVIAGNAATHGGGINNMPTGDLTILQCTITANEARATSGGIGGGINNALGQMRVENSLIVMNHAVYTLETGWEREEDNFQSFIISQNLEVDLFFYARNNFIGRGKMGNSVGQGSNTTDDKYGFNTDNRGNVFWSPENHNNPFFVDWANGDYRLVLGSSAIPNDGTVIGAFEFAYGKSVESQSIIVTSLDDICNPHDNLITLREAIAYANCGDTITFAPTMFLLLDRDELFLSIFSIDNIASGTAGTAYPIINLSGSEIFIDKNITIDATGLDITIDAGGLSRVFSIAEGITVTLIGLTITGGYVDDNGGGIFNQGTLTVIDCTITNNFAESGGGIYNHNTGYLIVSDGSTISKNTAKNWGGGVYNNFGTLTVIDSTISDNTSLGTSVFISGFEVGGGGGIFGQNNAQGSVTISNSTITGNKAINSGGGGIYNNGGTLIVTNDSTISDNYAIRGGGIANISSTLEVTGSTISDNRTIANGDGGGIFHNTGSLTVTSSVISGNSANHGGGIFNTNSTATITSSEIAKNKASSIQTSYVPVDM